MKSIDQFIGRMMESARLVQAKDVSSATAVIQQALAQAGLVPSQAGQPAPSATLGQAAFVDINPVPGAPMPGAPMPGAPMPGAPLSGAPWSGAPLADGLAQGWSVPDWKSRLRQGQAAMRTAGFSLDGDDDVAVIDEVAGGTFVAGVFANAAGRRRYKLYIPAQAASTPRPLIVMLHGCTQNPDDFAVGTGMNRLAEEAGCLVLYPEQDSASNRTHCWNWFEPGHQGRDAGEPGIIAGMTRQIIGEYGADPAQVFVAGMSAGGAMAALMGAAYPELFAAVGVHSGLPAGSARDMITGLQAMKKPGKGRALHAAVPVIVFHGQADHVVAPANGEAVLQQYVGAHAGLRAAPLDLRHEDATHGGRGCRRSTWRDASGRAMAEHWVVQGAGHAWAGGNPAGSHTDAAGPCASREMLRFFLAAGG